MHYKHNINVHENKNRDPVLNIKLIEIEKKLLYKTIIYINELRRIKRTNKTDGI